MRLGLLLATKKVEQRGTIQILANIPMDRLCLTVAIMIFQESAHAHFPDMT